MKFQTTTSGESRQLLSLPTCQIQTGGDAHYAAAISDAAGNSQTCQIPPLSQWMSASDIDTLRHSTSQYVTHWAAAISDTAGNYCIIKSQKVCIEWPIT